jgi:hypothetical protein
MANAAPPIVLVCIMAVCICSMTIDGKTHPKQTVDSSAKKMELAVETCNTTDSGVKSLWPTSCRLAAILEFPANNWPITMPDIGGMTKPH